MMLKISNHFKHLLTCLVIFLLIQCNDSSDITHPTHNNFPQTIGFDNLDLNETPQMTAEDFNKKLFNEKKSIELKVPDEYEFTETVDIAIANSAKNIYLLVDNRNQVLAFNKEGRFKYTIGQSGRGPGDLTSPLSLQVTSAGDLAILDRDKVEIISHENDKIEVLKTIMHGLDSVYDMCISNNDIFISGFKIEESNSDATDQKIPIEVSKPIHHYNLNRGEKLNSFGINYNTKYRWPVFDGQLSSATISCNSNSEYLVAMNNIFPFLYMYGKNGELLKASSIKNFASQKVFENMGNNNLPNIRFGSSVEGINYAYNLTLDNDGEHAFLQINNRFNLPNYELEKLNSLLKNIKPKSYIFKLNLLTGDSKMIVNSAPYVKYFSQSHYIISDNIGETMFDEFMREGTSLTLIK